MKTRVPAWIETSRRRARKWVLADVGLSAKEWDALTYEQLMKLPIIKRMSLSPSGGYVRFPGHERQENVFRFTITKNRRLHGGGLRRGELFSGHGDTLADAVRAAIQVAVELVSLRGERK